MRLPINNIHNIYSRLKYAVMAEILGRGGHIASEVVNCSAPDTGNMGMIVRAQHAGAFSYVASRGIGTVWISRTKEEMARPTSEWRDSFRFCDDRKIW